jgi:hypothetical protein
MIYDIEFHCLDPDDISYDYTSRIRAQPFPKIRSWKLHAEPNVLTFFNLENAESLDFNCEGVLDETMLAAVPTQLNHLTLSAFVYCVRSPASLKPLVMPQLTSLTLTYTTFIGHMQEYFNFPKLKSLHLEYVRFITSNDPVSREEQAIMTAKSLSNEQLFRGIPKLELLTLSQMPVDEILTSTLKSCPVLRELIVDKCPAEVFLSTLIPSLTDSKSFPSLGTLKVNNSWSDKLPFSFTGFVKYCSKQRPGMFVLGNGRAYIPPVEPETEVHGDDSTLAPAST